MHPPGDEPTPCSSAIEEYAYPCRWPSHTQECLEVVRFQILLQSLIATHRRATQTRTVESCFPHGFYSSCLMAKGDALALYSNSSELAWEALRLMDERDLRSWFRCACRQLRAGSPRRGHDPDARLSRPVAAGSRRRGPSRACDLRCPPALDAISSPMVDRRAVPGSDRWESVGKRIGAFRRRASSKGGAD
jgi:hypothetical protein